MPIRVARAAVEANHRPVQQLLGHMERDLGGLAKANVAVWGLASLAFQRLLGGEWTLVYAGVAMLLCLVPGVLTLLALNWAVPRDPAQAPLLILGATGVRMFTVLAAGFLLLQTVPLFRAEEGFLIWLLTVQFGRLALRRGRWRQRSRCFASHMSNANEAEV